MTTPDFAKFLEDDEAYEDSVRFWERLVREIGDSLHQDPWEPWISRYYADGKTLIDRDLTPILSGRSERLDRAFRIDQHAPSQDVKPAFYGRVERYGPEWDQGTMPAAELFIVVVPADDTIRGVRTLLRKWMNPKTSVDEMETFLSHSPAA